VPFLHTPASLNEPDDGAHYEEETNVLTSESPWSLVDSKRIARGSPFLFPSIHVSRFAEILQDLEPHLSRERAVKHILETMIKPIFRASNPHPHVNPLTGKSISQSQISRAPQQGGMASVTQDFFESEGQRWKDVIGLESVLYWCVDHIEVRTCSSRTSSLPKRTECRPTSTKRYGTLSSHRS